MKTKAILAAVTALIVLNGAILTGCAGETVTQSGTPSSETASVTAGGGDSATTAPPDSAEGSTAEGETTTADAAATSEVPVKWSVKIPGKEGSLCGAPIYIAYSKGFFREEGLDVELISADTETRKLGLADGSIPMVNGDFQFFPSIENGVQTKVVDGLHNGCIKLVVRPDSDIKTAADLKGKKIGVDEIGGTPFQVASVWVEEAEISAKNDVTFAPFADGALELQALYNGEIDVAAMWDPLGSVAEKEGKVKVIFDLATEPGFAGKYCCFLYASNTVLEKDPAQIAALLRAYNKAQDWISKNPDEAVQTIIDGKYSAITDADLAKELISHYDYPDTHAHETNKQDVGKDVLYFAQKLYDIGYLTTNPEEFVKQAYEKVDLTLGQ